MDNKTNYFELLDGSMLEGYPIANPSAPISNDFALDTSGAYLSIGRKPVKPVNTPLEDEEERQRGHRLFYENIPLFLANADRILKDSLLFLAPVHVQNGIAYTDTSGFRHPTLGVYIEWWRYYKEDSIDRHGRPIWYISGSPLSGCHVCASVDSNGVDHKAELCGNFSGIWAPFTDVNTRYDEAKARFMAYTLEEAIALLKNETTENQLLKMHIRLEHLKLSKMTEFLQAELRTARGQATEYKDRLIELLVEDNREAVTAYHEKCLNLQTIAKLRYEHFLKRRAELRRQQHAGEITNKEYQQAFHSIKIERQDADFAAQNYEQAGLAEIFGDDARLLSFDVIDNIIKDK